LPALQVGNHASRKVWLGDILLEGLPDPLPVSKLFLSTSVRVEDAAPAVVHSEHADPAWQEYARAFDRIAIARRERQSVCGEEPRMRLLAESDHDAGPD